METPRPFRLGFTRWPADLTREGVQMAERFAHAHGDIVSVMFIGGIPWQEALDGKPFSRDVESQFAYRPPAGVASFVSISPLAQDRKSLAAYWGEKDNQPLPPEWAARAFDSPEVRQAYAAFVLRVVERMRPDYLAVAIEANVCLSHDPARWRALKTLVRETYAAVKAKHPALPTFFTTEVLHYKKLASEAKGSAQEAEVADLLRHSDLLALSLYPHMSHGVPRPMPADFLDFAARLGKPVAVAESGMTSRDVTLKAFNVTLYGSESDQTAYFERLMSVAQRDRYRFVVNFATTDFEKLCAKLPPPADDLARIWAHTGLQDADGRPKPALAVWETARRRPRAIGSRSRGAADPG